MSPIVTLVMFMAILAAVLYAVLRVVGKVWLEHRVRLALLERIEKRPELAESVQGLMDLMGSPETVAPKGHQDYTVTGGLLALIGGGCCLAGWLWHSGKLAVSVYVGGWICVGVGFLLFLFGLFVRKLMRHPVFFPPGR